MVGPFSIAEAALALTVLVAHLIQVTTALVSLRRMRRATAPPLPAASPDPVTILLPFTGLDAHSARTMASGFALTYPHYELIFCAPSADEPAVPIVRSLIESHGEVRARLLIGRDRTTANPKLDNLDKAWAEARTERIVIADCNVLLPPGYVEQMLDAWRPDTGLVTALPVGSEPESFWAEVECAFLNTYQARLQLFADAFGKGFAHGKAMAFRRDLLAQRGGFRALAFDVAEDSAATKIVRAAGLRVRIMSTLLNQPLGSRSLSDVWRRQLRWAQIRRHSFPSLFAAEILSTSTLPLLAAAALAASLGAPALPAAAASPALWLSVEAYLARRGGWHLSPLYPVAGLCRDVMIATIWVLAWFRTTYRWRGNPVDLKDGLSEPPPCDGGASRRA